MLRSEQYEVNMNTLKSSVFERLILQSEELKERGFEKVASNIVEALEDTQKDVSREYSYSELQEDLNADLWKAATRFISYYNLDSADVGKLQQALLYAAAAATSEIEQALGVNDKTRGTLEPKVPGENK